MSSSPRDRCTPRVPGRPMYSKPSRMKCTDFDVMRNRLFEYDKLHVRHKKGLLGAVDGFVEKARKHIKARNEAQLAAAMKAELIANPRMSMYFGTIPWEAHVITRLERAHRKEAPQPSKKRKPTPKSESKLGAQPMKIYDPTPKSLDKLPAEIQCLIFSYIDDECTSACLGLTCRSLYEIHHKEYPVTDPFTRCYVYGKVDIRLYELLSGSMGIKWCLKIAKDVGYLEFEESVSGMARESEKRRAEIAHRR